MDKIKEFLNCLLHFNMPKSNAAVEKNPRKWKFLIHYQFKGKNIGFGFMALNAHLNNISAISWTSVLLVEETGVPGENHQPRKHRM